MARRKRTRNIFRRWTLIGCLLAGGGPAAEIHVVGSDLPGDLGLFLLPAGELPPGGRNRLVFELEERR